MKLTKNCWTGSPSEGRSTSYLASWRTASSCASPSAHEPLSYTTSSERGATSRRWPTSSCRNLVTVWKAKKQQFKEREREREETRALFCRCEMFKGMKMCSICPLSVLTECVLLPCWCFSSLLLRCLLCIKTHHFLSYRWILLALGKIYFYILCLLGLQWMY